MKKIAKRPLRLNPETIRCLTDAKLREVGGAYATAGCTTPIITVISCHLSWCEVCAE